MHKFSGLVFKYILHFESLNCFEIKGDDLYKNSLLSRQSCDSFTSINVH